MNAANLHYQQGAAAGNTQCMYRLGRLAQGRGDHSAACAFFQRAADADHTQSMLALGLCFEAGGVGVQKDECQAAKLYRLAADRGDVRAMVALGLCLQRGVSASTAQELGLSDARDEAQAMSLFQRAADGGDGRACFLLGLCFQSGAAGQQPDLRHAAQMFSRGAERDDAPAMVAFGICLEQVLLFLFFCRHSQVFSDVFCFPIQFRDWESTRMRLRQSSGTSELPLNTMTPERSFSWVHAGSEVSVFLVRR
jgi:TPR repeat protein